MKKILLLILASFSLLLVGCANNTNTPVVDEPNIVETQKFVVSFYKQDDLLSLHEYEEGDKVNVIPQTETEGFDFEGWYLNPKLTGTAVNFETLLVTENFTFYGKWVKEVVYVEPELPDNFTGYYQSLSNLSGAQLQAEVTRLVKNTGTATGTTPQVKQADVWQNSTYNIYTGLGAYGNREHVWPNSKLGSAPSYDLHNLRASLINVNSTRSNYPYGTGSGSWKLNGAKFYPGDEHVGDVARIVLYIALRYNLNLNLVGNLDMFLTWHQQDPVNDFELTRNNRIESIQRNRNPFIDYPELVGLIYGAAPVSTQTYSIPSFMLTKNTLSFNNILVN